MAAFRAGGLEILFVLPWLYRAPLRFAFFAGRHNRFFEKHFMSTTIEIIYCSWALECH